MDIPQEEFEYRQTLAQLGVKIALAKGELASLGVKTTEYLDLQEDEVVARIQATLEASQEALTALNANRAELLEYERSLEEFAEDLKQWGVDLDEKEASFKEKTDKTLKDIDGKLAELKTAIEVINAKTASIKAEKEGLKRKEITIAARERAVNDKYATLLKTTERLKGDKK